MSDLRSAWMSARVVVMVFMVWFGLDISIASMIYYDAIWNSCCNSPESIDNRYRCRIGVACLHTCRVSVSTNEDEGAGGRIDGSLLQPRTLYSLRTGNNNNLIKLSVRNTPTQTGVGYKRSQRYILSVDVRTNGIEYILWNLQPNLWLLSDRHFVNLSNNFVCL